MPRTSLTPFGFGASAPLLSLHREMNRLFDDVFRGDLAARGLPDEQSMRFPSFNASMNVSETEKELRVCVELPGVTQQDIDVNLADDLLTISGEKKFESEQGGEKESFHRVECSYGSFQRSLRLPFAANPDEVKAAFHNGVLTITVPKSAQQQRSRKIQIAAEDAQIAGEQSQRSGDVSSGRVNVESSTQQDSESTQQGATH